MNHKVQKGQFTSLLKRKLETSSALLDALKQEYATLNGNDASALEQHTERKNALVTDLEKLEQEGRGLLASHGFNPGRQGMEQFIDALEGEQQNQALALWRELLSLLEQNHHQNLVNGVVIELRQQSVQQVLAAATGQEHSQTYDTKGKTRAGGHGHSIAKA